MLLSKRMSGKDFVGYVIAQVLGAILASAILMAIINGSANLGPVSEVGLGQDGFGSASYVGISMGGAFLVEVILTFVFVLTVLGVTSSEKMSSVADVYKRQVHRQKGLARAQARFRAKGFPQARRLQRRYRKACAPRVFPLP